MSQPTPKVSLALVAFGVMALVASIAFLVASFTLENEIGRAFALGAFFSGFIGAVLLFGFAKVIDLLDAIRGQMEAVNVRSESKMGDADDSKSSEPAG